MEYAWKNKTLYTLFCQVEVPPVTHSYQSFMMINTRPGRKWQVQNKHYKSAQKNYITIYMNIYFCSFNYRHQHIHIFKIYWHIFQHMTIWPKPLILVNHTLTILWQSFLWIFNMYLLVLPFHSFHAFIVFYASCSLVLFCCYCYHIILWW